MRRAGPAGHAAGSGLGVGSGIGHGDEVGTYLISGSRGSGGAQQALIEIVRSQVAVRRVTADLLGKDLGSALGLTAR